MSASPQSEKWVIEHLAIWIGKHLIEDAFIDVFFQINDNLKNNC
jgi:hypothetical protein